jgi:phosphoserine phosphatase
VWGTGEAITEAAMNGEMILKKFKRMALLEGLSEEVLQTVAENLPITKGASLDESPEILRI